MTAYYNEIDAYAAAWLRNLIAAGHIAHGVVDERSIEDVHPSDLDGFTQCHFFAGVGVWSLALRRAGWPDSRPIWTGSCPCQPFSTAGAGAGFADQRHLWPAFFHLIEKRRPECVTGEQVASKDAGPWIDLVQADMEGLGYPFGAIPFPSAGVGAPHIRDRLYWAGQSAGSGRARRGHQPAHSIAMRAGATSPSRLANAKRHLCGRQAEAAHHAWPQIDGPADRAGGCGGAPGGWLADASSERCAGQAIRLCERGQDKASVEAARPGPANGFWGNAEWVWCRDEKYRPIEPGTFPLAHGAPSRVGRLRAYGNAINAEAARVFIEAVMEAA